MAKCNTGETYDAVLGAARGLPDFSSQLLHSMGAFSAFLLLAAARLGGGKLYVSAHFTQPNLMLSSQALIL